MTKAFLLTIGNENYESIKSVPVGDGLEIMLDFFKLLGYFTKQFKNDDKKEVDHSNDDDFTKFLSDRGIKI